MILGLALFHVAAVTLRTPERAMITLILASLVASGYMFWNLRTDLCSYQQQERAIYMEEHKHRQALKDTRSKRIHELCRQIYWAQRRGYWIQDFGMIYFELAELVFRSNPASALRAYRIALNMGVTSDRVRSYIRSRMRTLEVRCRDLDYEVDSEEQMIHDVDDDWEEILVDSEVRNQLLDRTASLIAQHERFGEIETFINNNGSSSDNDDSSSLSGERWPVIRPRRVYEVVDMAGSEDDSGDAETETDAVTVISDFELQTENVHSHGAQAIICDIVDRLRTLVDLGGQTPMLVCQEVYTEIVQHTSCKPEVKDAALKTLNVILSQEGERVHIRQNCTEQEILARVYLRLKALDQADPIQILAEQLADNVDPTDHETEQYCPSGRFARIVASLNGIDPDIPLIRTTDMIKQELNNTVPRLRDEFFESFVTPAIKERYNNWDGVKDDEEMETLHVLLQQHVSKRCKDMYPHVDPSIFDQWIQEYLENL